MFPRLPQAVKVILAINVVVFLLQLVIGGLLAPFMLWPLGGADAGGLGFQPWQLLSYGFMHDPRNLAHLVFNMLALVMFGSQLEYTWGTRRFVTYYLVCVVGAGLCQLAVVTWSLTQGAFPYPTLGASGGVFGLLLAYGMLFPNQRIMLLFPPIPMRARTLVIVYGLVELVLGITGTRSGVAHFAHLGGMLFGWLLIQNWRGRPPFNRSRRHVRRL
ncbi:rhomboid family intramembrane serine protease [Luteimonas sp. TWI1416]|jgi:membrane associated rhomboid family serine protease|uniref:rhomboid family intramembrane serine protease n=1 Tax=unclassified Luteimonas TaxID=2629088 RepID=UPI0032093972